MLEQNFSDDNIDSTVVDGCCGTVEWQRDTLLALGLTLTHI